MIRKNISLFAYAALLILAAPFCVYAESVDSMDVTVVVQTNRSATVKEIIRYDFGEDQQHGIFRDIPTDTGTGLARREIDEDSIRVTDEQGTAYQFLLEPEFGILRIRIGDPDRLITGKHVYVVEYTVKDAVGMFDDVDEMYWNVTGNEWSVPIHAVKAEITVPGEFIRSSCYVGYPGSTEPCGTNEVGEGAKTVRFESRPLYAREGLTVAVGFAKGFVSEPSSTMRLMDYVRRYGIVLLPILAFVGMLYAWMRFGRDAKGRGALIPEYDAPKGYSPSLVATVYRGSFSAGALASEIIALAVQGYIRISRIEKTLLGLITLHDYEFERLRDADDVLQPHQRMLLEGMFPEKSTVVLSDMQEATQLKKTLEAMKVHIDGVIKDEKLYRTPEWVRAPIFVIGFMVVCIGFVMVSSWNIVADVSLVLTAIIIAVFGYLMPARTERGALMYEHVQGLRYYMEKAEKARLDFHSAPEKSPQHFEKLLPFALALGVTDAWVKEFEGLLKEAPEWYRDSSGGPFVPTAFASQMSSFNSEASSAAVDTSSGGGSSGGGFSGGGGGGGGGGSW